MLYCIFTESRDISGGHDAKVFRFYFKCVPQDKIGEPERISYISEYIVTVNCSRTLIRMFNIIDADIEKILYWVARRNFEKGSPKQEIKIELNNRNYPKGFPFDTSLINYPNPEGFFIESSEKIGF